MNFEEKDKKTDTISYPQKFAGIIAKLHKLKFANLLSGVSELEFKAMACINKMKNMEEQVKVSDIVKYLELSPPAISRVMKTLEEKNFIERHTDKEDRRNTNVTLTAEGKRQFKEWTKEFEDVSLAVFEKLGEEKSNQLLNIMEEFVQATKDEISRRSAK